jgi:hypothetical protein
MAIREMPLSDFVVVFCSTQKRTGALSLPSTTLHSLSQFTPPCKLLPILPRNQKDEKSVNFSTGNGTSKAKLVSEKASFSHKQRFLDTRWLLHWFVLITSPAVLLVTGIILTLVKSHPMFLGIPTPLLLAMKPIIRFLFARTRKQRYSFK